MVQVDRLLGVLPFSQPKPWRATFADLEPPALRAHMKRTVDDGVAISTAGKSFDAQPFMLGKRLRLPKTAKSELNLRRLA